MNKGMWVVGCFSFAAFALGSKPAQAVTMYAPSSDCRPYTSTDANNAAISYFDPGGTHHDGTWAVINNTVAVNFICSVRATGPLTSVTMNVSTTPAGWGITGIWYNTVGQQISSTGGATSGGSGAQSMSFVPGNMSGPGMPNNAFSGSIIVKFNAGSMWSQLFGFSYSY